MRRSCILWVTVLAAFLAAESGIRACTVFYSTVTTGPGFRVKVEDRGRPVEGLRVELRVGRAAMHHSITGKDGVALFRNVPPGSYMLGAAEDAGIEGGSGVQVKPEEPREIIVPLRWPSAQVISTAGLNGMLVHIPGQPQPGISVELLEGFSGRRLRTAITDDDGAFDFSEAAPGIYFLRLKLSGSADGELIAVEVEPGGSTAPMVLDLSWSSCGLSYVDQRKCPQTGLHLERFAGRVVDPTGAAISNAQILVLGAGGEVLHRTRSDDSGNFAMPVAAGTYRLQVQSGGFSTLRTTVTVGPGGSRSSFEAQLGVMGGCSGTKTN